jgi:hypothetical protein
MGWRVPQLDTFLRTGFRTFDRCRRQLTVQARRVSIASTAMMTPPNEGRTAACADSRVSK